MTDVPPDRRPSWWRPRWRDVLGLLSALSLVAFGWISTEFGGQDGRLLLVGPFDDLALRGLLIVSALGFASAWIVARSWLRPPQRPGGIAASTVVTVLALVLPIVPGVFALLTVAVSLESPYVRVPMPVRADGDELVLHIFDSWDDDESTQLYRRDGLFTYSATWASGYSRCVDEIHADDLVVSVTGDATTVSTDLTGCQFTPLVVPRHAHPSHPPGR
jgi:hypothetical protein